MRKFCNERYLELYNSEILISYCRNCDRLDVLVFKVPAALRQGAKMKVDQLKYDIRHLQVSWRITNRL